MPVKVEIGPLPSQPLARYLLLSAAVPEALAKARDTGAVDAAAARQEWLDRPGTGAPGAAYPTHTLRVRLDDLVRWEKAFATLDNIAPLSTLWQALAIEGDLVVLVEAPSRAVDLAAVTACLVAEPTVAAVAFAGQPGPPRVLQWPLRIGIGPGKAGDALRDTLADGRFTELYTLAEAGAPEVDLWLATESLDNAAATTRADSAVLLALGGAGTGASSPVLAELQANAGVAAVAACHVPSDEWGPWFQALVRELAHDRPLPAALFLVAKADWRSWEGPQRPMADLPSPTVLGDGDFLLSGSRISATAGAMGRALEFLPDDAIQATQELQDQLGFDGSLSIVEVFAKRATTFTFRNEEGDATSLVRIRRDLELQQGAMLPADGRLDRGLMAEAAPPDDDFAMAVPPGLDDDFVAPVDALEPDDSLPPPERHVQAKLLRRDGHDVSAQALAAAGEFTLRVHIGPPEAEVIIRADAALDESTLPHSEHGHSLAIAYIPLSRLAPDDVVPPPPQRAALWLPPAGASAPVEFTLRSGTEPANFRARLVVTFANRVLQTLLLETKTDGRLHLAEENIYQPVVVADQDTLPAQVAFVINDDPRGRPGLATLTMDSSSFIDSRSLATEIAAISLILEEANKDAVGTAVAFDDADAVGRLCGLAMHGASLLAEVQLAHGATRLAASTHVQLVEAVAEAFFPIEFLYEGEPPLPGAGLCPNARAALDNSAVHAGCPHATSEDHVCPAQFWGMRKCIERLPVRPAVPDSRDAALPAAAPGRFGPFQRALVGASRIAHQQMEGDNGLPKRVRASVTTVVVATDWRDWRDKVRDVSPDLIVLLPHSFTLAEVPGMAALEISTAELPSSSLRAPYVCGPVPPGPLVLLLGCSTALAQAPFLNFTRKFQQSGAPVVVGTLAKIHVTQAATIAARFLDLVDAGAPPRRFDEVLLDFKRQLLGEGHQGVLSLVCYGDASWKI